MGYTQARFRDFIRAFWSNWFALMSGSPSVPAAILAFYVQDTWAKIALWITAATCFVFSSYLVWRQQRLRVFELEGKLEIQERNKPKLAIEDVHVMPSGLADLPAISISFSVSNPGPPTTFHDWQLWTRTTTGKEIGVKIEGRLGLDAEGDLYFKPLETGGHRATVYEAFHYALDYDALRIPGTEITMKVKDIGDREIIAQYVIPTNDERRSSVLSVISSVQSEKVLEIIFDPANPGRKFWSIEPMKNDKGETIAGSFWEYRAVIKNNSARTVKNVKVSVEATGPMPTRPELSLFDINKKPLIDLTPNDEALVVIRCWFNPVRVVGMAIGTDIYGPIKVTATADDTRPTTKTFHFDPEKTPMIWE